MRNVGGRVEFKGSFAEDLPDLELPEVAFAGRSNVGKSSALNTLLGMRNIARVSGQPGRTQRINLFEVAGEVIFADLPGYGFAKVPEAVQRSWKGMIEGYLSERDTLRLVILLVDARRDPQSLDGELLYGLAEAKLPRLVLATKVDKLGRNARQKNLAAIKREFRLQADELVPFSSVDRTGFDATWDIIESKCRV